jgi:N-acetylglucosaminyldiphosphoundecaprenol N-acetyl-beta-D-mannosaminyltransferase
LAVSLATFFDPEQPKQKKVSKPLRVPSRCMIAGVAVDRLTMEEAAAQIVETLRRRSAPSPFLIMGPNAQIVTLAQNNIRFSEALHASALNIPDGISVLLASRILGKLISARVPGGELMERLCFEAARNGLSVFFLGGLPGAANQAARQLQGRYPALSVAGTYCPAHGFEHDSMENTHIRQLITEAEPDLLFVAFGAPKQEIWMHENCPSLPIGAALSVGAALDTQAGLRKRAPRWTHNLGLEWLYRLVHEPRRLWRRYLIGNTYFLYLVLKQIFVYASFPDREAALSHTDRKPNPFPMSPSIQPACDSVEAKSHA